MRWLQEWIVRLDAGPLHGLFVWIYSLGVRCVVKALAASPAVHSIYGCGSFFEGRLLPGHSDVDLVIVLASDIQRSQGDHGDVIRRYRRVQRIFPFLGRWDEKAGSLIFLEEIETGLPLLESFRLRWKLGRFVKLHGDDLPFDPPAGRPTPGEVVVEINALVRLGASAGRQTASRLLFWKRLFGKLHALAEASELEDAWANEVAAPIEIGDREAFFESASPAPQFDLFLDTANRLLEAIAKREASVSIRVEPTDLDSESEVVHPPQRLRSVLFASGAEASELRAIPSLCLGMRAGLSYFALDASMPIVELRGETRTGLARLSRALMSHGDHDDALLATGGGFAFVLSRQEHYVEVVPLDALAFADVHARIRGDGGCEMPASVYAHERERAEQRLEAMRFNYDRHEGWIPKAPFPCIYLEEDEDVMREALEFLRSHALLRHDLRFHTQRALVQWWRERNPEAAPFLDAAEAELVYVSDRSGPRPPANALYRVLHSFMRQALAGESEMVLPPVHQTLSVSVAIVTRNRASDLQRALASLTKLTRTPEEIIIVDNGSTDDTESVVRGFEGLLPLRYDFLEEPGIPGARNRAVELATGEIIAFTDDDAACTPEWLESVERSFLRADNVGLVGGWVEHWARDTSTAVDAYYQLFHNHKP